jgi:toxin ParE1/3/4
MRWHSVRGFRKYLVFYIPRSDGIEVVRVLHGARDLEALFRS